MQTKYLMLYEAEVMGASKKVCWNKVSLDISGEKSYRHPTAVLYLMCWSAWGPGSLKPASVHHWLRAHTFRVSLKESVWRCSYSDTKYVSKCSLPSTVIHNYTSFGISTMFYLLQTLFLWKLCFVWVSIWITPISFPLLQQHLQVQVEYWQSPETVGDHREEQCWEFLSVSQVLQGRFSLPLPRCHEKEPEPSKAVNAST